MGDGLAIAELDDVDEYHPETRSLLANVQEKAAKDSYDDLRWNEDGPADISFGPEPPEGYEGNWVKTLPNQGWMILLRLHDPLAAHFNGAWKPDDFVRSS